MPQRAKGSRPTCIGRPRRQYSMPSALSRRMARHGAEGAAEPQRLKRCLILGEASS
jgi:hypothetical protein